MVEKGILNGITQTVKRYDRVNNKYMKDLYNPDEESIYTEYLDANNLSGWLMINNLPTHRFKCKKAKKDNRDYLLEVDIEYPKELHENHNELPFLAERMKIGNEEK